MKTGKNVFRSFISLLFSSRLYWTIGIPVFVNLVYVSASWYSITSNGADEPLRDFALPMLALFSMTVLYLVISITGRVVLWRFNVDNRGPRELWNQVMFCTVSILVTCINLLCVGAIRGSAYQKIAVHGEPLVIAVRKYQELHGVAPPDLNNLEPALIKKVLETGVAAYPHFIYIRNYDSSKYSANSWILIVPVSQARLLRSELVFYPNQKYPSQIFGIYRTSVGQWVLLKSAAGLSSAS